MWWTLNGENFQGLLSWNTLIYFARSVKSTVEVKATDRTVSDRLAELFLGEKRATSERLRVTRRLALLNVRQTATGVPGRRLLVKRTCAGI